MPSVAVPADSPAPPPSSSAIAGYPNVVVTNGTEPFGGTVIYVADGLQPSAERLVDDIQAIDPEFVEPAFIVPLADAPATTPALEDVDMILYLGQDQV